MTPKITATAHKWQGGWELHLNGEPATQVTTLDKAVQQIRDYLDTTEPEIDHSDWQVLIAPELGELGVRIKEA